MAPPTVARVRRVVLAAIAFVVMAGGALVISASRDGGDTSNTVTAGDSSTATTGGSTASVSAGTASTSATGAAKGAVTFAFAGDVNFPDEWYTEPGLTPPSGPTLAEQLRADPKQVLAPIAPVLRSADVTVVNLETAITDRGEPVPGKNYHFRSSPLAFTALKSAGVDVVSMANNHVLDYGPVGMQDTFAAIDAAKAPVIGIGHNATEAFRPFRTTMHGQRVAVISALDWLEPALVDSWTATDTQAGVAMSIDRTRLLAAVRATRPEVDTLVVFLHWGTEETYCASGEQEDLAAALMDAGADLVVGSHAHHVFGAGYSHFGPALVAYGLGNFVYWRDDGESGRSGVLQVTVTGRHVDGYSWVPARITHGVATPLEGAAAAADVAEWEQRRNCSGLAP
jgi:poly-gamma-glutamate synthesis protein (capsule biosynthesis protein)